MLPHIIHPVRHPVSFLVIIMNLLFAFLDLSRCGSLENVFGGRDHAARLVVNELAGYVIRNAIS